MTRTMKKMRAPLVSQVFVGEPQSSNQGKDR